MLFFSSSISCGAFCTPENIVFALQNKTATIYVELCLYSKVDHLDLNNLDTNLIVLKINEIFKNLRVKTKKLKLIFAVSNDMQKFSRIRIEQKKSNSFEEKYQHLENILAWQLQTGLNPWEHLFFQSSNNFCSVKKSQVQPWFDIFKKLGIPITKISFHPEIASFFNEFYDNNTEIDKKQIACLLAYYCKKSR